MNQRDTLQLQLNVFADFTPQLPSGYREAQYVFLANIDPRLQAMVLDQVAAPGLVGQSLLTPACGMGSRSVAEANAVLDVLTEVAAAWPPGGRV
jgi:hypothetical protein